MVLLGVYHTVTAAISSLNIPVLIPLGMGIVIGLLSGAKLISRLLARFAQKHAGQRCRNPIPATEKAPFFHSISRFCAG